MQDTTAPQQRQQDDDKLVGRGVLSEYFKASDDLLISVMIWARSPLLYAVFICIYVFIQKREISSLYILSWVLQKDTKATS